MTSAPAPTFAAFDDELLYGTMSKITTFFPKLLLVMVFHHNSNTNKETVMIRLFSLSPDCYLKRCCRLSWTHMNGYSTASVDSAKMNPVVYPKKV